MPGTRVVVEHPKSETEKPVNIIAEIEIFRIKRILS
jgi:hypothetical protein